MKAILVIDVPENCRLIDTQNKCRGCAFYYENKDNRMSCYIDDYIKDCKGTCPLKPLPQKKKLDGDLFLTNNFKLQYARFKGYNECIDDILGGNNE